MTLSWKAMSDDQKKATSSLFDALSAIDALEGHGKAALRTISFADLYEYANNPNGVMSADLGRALVNSESLRKDLDQLINRLSVYHFPKVAAASSGLLDSREGDGYRIKLKSSRANEKQIYIIIEVSNFKEQLPESLIVKLEDGRYIKQPLANGVNGSYQLLLDTDTPIVLALRNIKTEVFLL